MFRLSQIDHVALTVNDPKKSAEWYRDVLGLECQHQEAWGDCPIMMCAGSTCVALFSLGEKKPGLPADKLKPAMPHLAFRTDRQNFEKAQQVLRERGIGFEFDDHQIAHSIYFGDPDGHQLEITTYEVGRQD